MRVFVRYDYPDENEQTRRERNEHMADEGADVESPPLIIPDEGQYLWDWYDTLNKCVSRTREGHCNPIPPSEFLAWKEASGLLINSSEYAVLCAMDRAYCEEMNKELAAYRERQREAAKAGGDKP